jgi:GxxExxY protein
MENKENLGSLTFRSGFGKRYDSLSDKIIGAGITVHRSLGPGFLESVYEEAMAVELQHQGLVYQKQKEIEIYHRDIVVGKHRLDLVVENKIIVELKAVKEMIDVHFAQLRSYLKATGLRVGLLLNFALPTLDIKRIVN